MSPWEEEFADEVEKEDLWVAKLGWMPYVLGPDGAETFDRAGALESVRRALGAGEITPEEAEAVRGRIAAVAARAAERRN